MTRNLDKTRATTTADSYAWLALVRPSQSTVFVRPVLEANIGPPRRISGPQFARKISQLHELKMISGRLSLATVKLCV